MRYEKGWTTYANLRDWPQLQGRLAKVNWTKVAELARRLITSSITVLEGDDRISAAAAEFLRSRSDLPVKDLSIDSVLTNEYEVDSPKTCLLVLSRTGKPGRTAEAVKSFRKSHPEARVLLLASRQSPVAGLCHCGITPPGVDDLTSVGPTADSILLWMTALIGDAVRTGSYLPACSLLDEKQVLASVEKGLEGCSGKIQRGVVWACESSIGFAAALAKAAGRLSNCEWDARLLTAGTTPDLSAFNLIFGPQEPSVLERFQSGSGIVIGGDKPDVEGWASVNIPCEAGLSLFNLYQLGLDICWLWSRWNDRNPDQYFTLTDKAQPEEQKA